MTTIHGAVPNAGQHDAVTGDQHAPAWRPQQVPGELPLSYGRTGEGPEPVVALHGITSQHRSFNAIARELQHPDGVAALDLRGRGDSAQPGAGSYGLAAHAADVVRLLDHLGIRRGMLVGHSMGAFVALRVALQHPDRVRGIVLIDGGWPRPGQPPAGLDDDLRTGLERAFGRLGRTFDSHDAYLDYWFPGQQLTLDSLAGELADYYRYDLAGQPGLLTPKASLEAATEDAASVLTACPTAAQQQRIGCPVALVCAAHGFLPGSAPLINEATRLAMLESLPVVFDRTVPGADHYSLMFSPHAAHVVEAVQALLTLDR